MRIGLSNLFWLNLCVFFSASSFADAIIKTEAMYATTILEVFVEESLVSVKMEVGLDDVKAFDGLAPSAEFDQLSLGMSVPVSNENLKRFFKDQFILKANGEALSGVLRALDIRSRIPRDEITGKEQAGRNKSETVLFVELEYSLPNKPDTLVIEHPGSPRRANIGFAVYHQGIRVNDFRYLWRACRLNLDWSDPWYSRFDDRNLQRQYFSPMAGFLYIEPFEVRKEILVRPKDLDRWLDLGLEGASVISAEDQSRIKDMVADFIDSKIPVVIDGMAAEPIRYSVNFITQTLAGSQVVATNENIDLSSAMIGLIYLYPVPDLPGKVVLRWDLFDERISSVPVVAVDQAGPLPQIVDENNPSYEWVNFLKNPEIPGLSTLQEVPSPWNQFIQGWFWLIPASLALVAVFSIFARGRGKRLHSLTRPPLILLSCILISSVSLLFWIRGSATSNVEIANVTKGLLKNIYHAFYFRNENEVYDVLSLSVSGDLLTQIYLQTRQSLSLESQGGAVVRVKDVELIDIEVLSAPASGTAGFSVEATWLVSGNVGHWGHVHERVNKYQAVMDIQPNGGLWKLVALNVLSEERL